VEKNGGRVTDPETGRRLPPAEQRKRKREWGIIAFAVILIGVCLWAEKRLMILAGGIPRSYNVVIFAVINIILLLVILLVYLVFRNVAKVLLERSGGAKLKTKLVLSFIGLSLIPTMLLFFVSAGFIKNTIQHWFNKQVEQVVSVSMEVAGTYYKASGANALYYGGQIAGTIKDRKLLNDENLPSLRDLIHRKQREYNLGVVEVFSAQHEELVRASNPAVPQADFTNPSSEDIREGLAGKELTKVNPIGRGDLIRGIVPVRSTWNPKDIVGVVVVNYYVPYSLKKNLDEITRNYQQYRQIEILKNPITTGYILTLFLITLVIVFLAIWFGVYLANGLTIPIQELAHATREVADGNLDVKIDVAGGDEIGMLVTAFNRMTEDLRSHQSILKKRNEEIERNNLELDRRRRYMEIILENVTAGVVSVSREGVLTTVNKSAERLLNIRTDKVIGKNFREVLGPGHLDTVKELLREMVLAKQDTVRKQVTVPIGESKITLLVNLTMLKDENGEFLGTVVVFDDLTQVIKAQRMAAWREVARRIAHEIKNPLTPIRLSAQRLRKRYLDRFGSDEKVFDECTEMIIKSVDELKTLVDEFSSFARMPAAQPSPNDLNAIIREALTLYQEGHRNIRFSFSGDEAIPPIQLDRDQIKRVMINLLDNAVAAIEGEGEIALSTMFNQELKMATCTVADTGQGIAPEDRPRLFEPYFSTKKSGTGLGLAIVNTIVTDHHGFIRVKDNVPKGTKVVIELPVNSSWV
jgi:two-component system, NtrC family, nitrogen regulation sensor histidine kinase NtrY